VMAPTENKMKEFKEVGPACELLCKAA
jgi:hypothetical protein